MKKCHKCGTPVISGKIVDDKILCIQCSDAKEPKGPFCKLCGKDTSFQYLDITVNFDDDPEVAICFTCFCKHTMLDGVSLADIAEHQEDCTPTANWCGEEPVNDESEESENANDER